MLLYHRSTSNWKKQKLKKVEATLSSAVLNVKKSVLHGQWISLGYYVITDDVIIENKFERIIFRYKNGDALENDDKYKISTDGRWHYVEIRNVSIEDEGEYVARINGSSFESMAQLLVDMTKVSFIVWRTPLDFFIST